MLGEEALSGGFDVLRCSEEEVCGYSSLCLQSDNHDSLLIRFARISRDFFCWREFSVCERSGYRKFVMSFSFMIDLPKLSKAYLPCGFNSVLHRVVNSKNRSYFCHY